MIAPPDSDDTEAKAFCHSNGLLHGPAAHDGAQAVVPVYQADWAIAKFDPDGGAGFYDVRSKPLQIDRESHHPVGINAPQVGRQEALHNLPRIIGGNSLGLKDSTAEHPDGIQVVAVGI
jgi:hypothetical protein